MTDCCNEFTLVNHNNISNHEIEKGTAIRYCKKVTCLKTPCINFRVYRKLNIYKNGFDKKDIIYYEIFHSDIDKVFMELKNLFHKVLVFDCFDYLETYFALPRNKKVTTNIFNIVSDYQNQLKTTIYNHMVTTNTYIPTNKLRVKYINIYVNKIIPKIPTINGFYTTPAGITDKKEKHRIKYLPHNEVLFRFHLMDINTNRLHIVIGTFEDMIINTIISFLFPEMLIPTFQQQLEDYYAFGEADFEKFCR